MANLGLDSVPHLLRLFGLRRWPCRFPHCLGRASRSGHRPWGRYVLLPRVTALARQPYDLPPALLAYSVRKILRYKQMTVGMSASTFLRIYTPKEIARHPSSWPNSRRSRKLPALPRSRRILVTLVSLARRCGTERCVVLASRFGQYGRIIRSQRRARLTVSQAATPRRQRYAVLYRLHLRSMPQPYGSMTVDSR